MKFNILILFAFLSISPHTHATEELATVSLQQTMKVEFDEGKLVITTGKTKHTFKQSELNTMTLNKMALNHITFPNDLNAGTKSPLQLTLVPRLKKDLPSDTLSGFPMILEEDTLIIRHSLLGMLELKRSFLLQAKVPQNRLKDLQGRKTIVSDLLPLPVNNNETKMRQNDVLIKLTDGTSVIFKIVAINKNKLTVTHQAFTKSIFIPVRYISSMTFIPYQK